MTDDGDGPAYHLAFTVTDDLTLMVFDDDATAQPVDECSVGADLDIRELEEAAARLTGDATPDDIAEARERVRKLIAPLKDTDDELTPHERGLLRGYRNALTVIGGADRDEMDDAPGEKSEKSAHDAVQSLRDDIRRTRARNINPDVVISTYEALAVQGLEPAEISDQMDMTVAEVHEAIAHYYRHSDEFEKLRDDARP